MSLNEPKENVLDRSQLAQRLREARDYLGLSQEEVSRILKVPRSAISLIESGERKVDVLELKRFADLYKQPIEHFTGGSSKSSTEEFKGEVAHLARAASRLSVQDRAELMRFTEFLQTISKSGGQP